MKRYLTALFVTLCLPLGAVAQALSGDWSGDLHLGTQKLSLIFHFVTDKAGQQICTVDVPAQGAKGIPAEVLHNERDSVSLSIPSIIAKYSGTRQGSTVHGIFAQSGYTFTLDLTEVIPTANTIVRPQTPTPPFPYSTEELAVAGGAEGVRLAGTLCYPRQTSTDGKKSVVVLISGSGPQNRDEELLEHRPFAVIADHLARHGIASYRYDDRGVGSSTGVFKGCTTEDFARDASAVIRALRELGRFDHVGVLGHSEGGLIAFMLGARGEPDFIISMAGPGIKGDSLVTEQSNKQLELQGLPATLTREMVRAQFLSMDDPWMHYFMDYDPTADIRAVQVPTFALNGTLDTQVIESSNLGAIRANLPKNPHNFIRSYEGLNHLLQHAITGSSMEYYDIEETISPNVLDDIVNWIKSL